VISVAFAATDRLSKRFKDQGAELGYGTLG
jgi:hypothetical protein